MACAPGLAVAWNAAGHRLTVAIAWTEIPPPARQEIERLLRAHPAIASWEKQAERQPWGGALLAEASTWPDDLRRRARELEARDGSPVAGDTVHADWHFLDRPIGATAARSGQLDRQLARLARRLADRNAPAGERAVALAWLVHLVGDAHMPLHVSTWRDARGEWTAGGNGVAVDDPTNPRLPQTNLHRYWDDLPGAPWLRGHRLLKRAAALREKHAAAEVAQGTSEAWIDESHVLATEIARRVTGDPFVVDAAYRDEARAVADRQIMRAGVRLGRWLGELLGRE